MLVEQFVIFLIMTPRDVPVVVLRFNEESHDVGSQREKRKTDLSAVGLREIGRRP
jgi:hypothetical protein